MNPLAEAFAALFTAWAFLAALLLVVWTLWAIAERLRR